MFWPKCSDQGAIDVNWLPLSEWTSRIGIGQWSLNNRIALWMASKSVPLWATWIGVRQLPLRSKLAQDASHMGDTESAQFGEYLRTGLQFTVCNHMHSRFQQNSAPDCQINHLFLTQGVRCDIVSAF